MTIRKALLLTALVLFLAGCAISPSGNITDTTPTYKWYTTTNATEYRFQTVRTLTDVVYTITVPKSKCAASTCSFTPETVLEKRKYWWHVQAKVGGEWKTYSAWRAFRVK